MTRIVARASLDISASRGWRLATVRSLPGMALLRSVPYGDDGALEDVLSGAWRELGDGLYLLTAGPVDGPRHWGVVVEGGIAVEREPLTAEEAAALPSVLDRELASPAPVVVGGAVDVELGVGEGDGAGAVAG